MLRLVTPSSSILNAKTDDIVGQMALDNPSMYLDSSLPVHILSNNLDLVA
jgi:hypothetical protein